MVSDGRDRPYRKNCEVEYAVKLRQWSYGEGSGAKVMDEAVTHGPPKSRGSSIRNRTCLRMGREWLHKKSSGSNWDFEYALIVQRVQDSPARYRRLDVMALIRRTSLDSAASEK